MNLMEKKNAFPISAHSDNLVFIFLRAVVNWNNNLLNNVYCFRSECYQKSSPENRVLFMYCRDCVTSLIFSCSETLTIRSLYPQSGI